MIGSIRRILVLALAAMVILVVAGAAAWWFFVREDHSLATAAPEIPQELKIAQTTPTPADSSGSRTFKIVAGRSEAAYFVDEKLARLSLPSTAKGITKAISGEFHLTADGLDPSKTSKFTVDLKTLRSDEGQRDSRVQGQALETSKFPTATFTATKVTGFPKEFVAGQEAALQLTGMLDLHGVQKEVTWDVKMKKEGEVFSALATVNFKFAEFNIPLLNLAGFVTIQDNVTLQVQVIAQAS